MDNQITRILPDHIKRLFLTETEKHGKPLELRFRIGKPFIIVFDSGEKVYHSHIISSKDMKDIFTQVCEYSAYAYEEEMKQGFITIAGGHRAGIAGQVITENGKVRNIRHISCINLRVASEVKGCADGVLDWMVEDGKVLHTLIISPPGVGKTTLLRDIIRQLSDGISSVSGRSISTTRKFVHGRNISVVDERSEICACYRGIPQNDVGIRTDVLDMCPKAEGVMRLVRSMSPEIIAVDEIGTKEDLAAVRYVLTCGCTVIATLHGSGIPKYMLDDNMFERYIILEKYLKNVNSTSREKSYRENNNSVNETKLTVRMITVHDGKGRVLASC